ncbi:MAG: hypothetical protein KBA33_08260 [Cloacibacterium sp.]|nr:hypothetical protein [Cloacibacterium sp.]
MTREEQLVLVLQYDSQVEKHLTDFDRMFIQKERSAYLQGVPYQMNDKTEEKIQYILTIVERINWNPEEY